LVDKQRLLVTLSESVGDAKGTLKAHRQLTMLQLELVKFVSDIGKAVYDCELYFAHEGTFFHFILLSFSLFHFHF
jgi:hypothetical protein